MEGLVPLCIYFFCYSFLGWVLETAYASFKQQRWVRRRGTYTQYFLPLYGGCAVLIVYCFGRIESIIGAALASAVAVTVLEYMVGWFLDKKYHTRLWDYRSRKLQIKGYVCLDFACIWCVLSCVVALFIHPVLAVVVYKLTFIQQLFTLTMLILCYGVDLLVTKRACPLYL
ncbi:MAG: putative ABC transporter permease [Cellulosilyticaceae bacterium]